MEICPSTTTTPPHISYTHLDHFLSFFLACIYEPLSSPNHHLCSKLKGNQLVAKKQADVGALGGVPWSLVAKKKETNILIFVEN